MWQKLAASGLRLRLNRGMKLELLLRLRGSDYYFYSWQQRRSWDHGVEAGPGALASPWPAILLHQQKGCFVMVITQREAISLQDALAGKLNKHWQWSFHRAAWPKQTAVERIERGKKVRKKGCRGGEKNEMASLLVIVGRESESGICCFFDFNQKQRRSAVEKAWRKAKFTWAKGGGGRRGERRAETNKQTTTDEQLHRALHWRRGRGRKRRKRGKERERESTLVTKMESPHFSAVWKYGPHFMIQFLLPPFSLPL